MKRLGILLLVCGMAPSLLAQDPAPAPAVTPEAAPTPWNLHFQTTFVWQDKRPFEAAYTGTNSLVPQRETAYTLTATLFLGARLWKGAELYLNPETIQSRPLSNLKGLGGLTNGENQKNGGPDIQLYRARLFLRQTFGLGGEKKAVEDGANQLAGTVDSRRLVVSVGNLAVMDVFDVNGYAHDPRTGFFNWAFMTYGAYDYAADARGYSVGAAVEYFRDEWAFRVGRFAQPRESNGLYLDNQIFQHFGDQIEVEHGHALGNQPGKLRLLAFRNVASMGSFREALEYAQVRGGTPALANVRRDQAKFGVGAAVEQNLIAGVGLFARWSWNDGKTETYAFTEIERSLATGIVAKGTPWRRPDDSVGVAFVQNGLGGDHRQYLAAGGLGAFIGDGALSYAPERVWEAFYNAAGSKGMWLSGNVQYITNPAYNAVRGPVTVWGCRIHVDL